MDKEHSRGKNLKIKYNSYRITQYILNRSYTLLPDDTEMVRFTTREDVGIVVDFVQKSHIQGVDNFPIENFITETFAWLLNSNQDFGRHILNKSLINLIPL